MSQYKPKNILVTGGCGFIGSNFVNQAVIKHPEYNFVNIDCLYECSSIQNITVQNLRNYEFIKGSITSYDLILHILEKHQIDTVIHFAAQSNVDGSFAQPLQYTHDNVIGTHTLLEACRHYGKVNRFIYFSTDEVYGESELHTEDQKNEKTILCPTNPYAATKAAAELIANSYLYSYKFPMIITRCNNVYGERQYPEKIIPRFICLLKENQKCTIHGNGRTVRSFIHTDDVTKAVLFILHNGELNEIYNISCDDEYSVLDIAKLLIKRIKNTDQYDDWITYVKDREFNDKRYLISSEKLQKMGWQIETDFRDGIEKTVSWYLNINPYQHWNHLKL